MKKLILTTALTLFSITLFAMPYYSVHREGHTTYVFHGQIDEENEPQARKLEIQFMEYEDSRWHYEKELARLGIQVEEVESDDHERTQLPLEVDKPSLPEGVTG